MAAHDCLFLDTVDSTQGALKRRLCDGDTRYRAVVAREQTNGRGRQGRNWDSKPGNLFISWWCPLPAGLSADEQASITLLAGIALHTALCSLDASLQEQLSLKWPNDVLCGEAKLAGILCETVQDGSAVVIGAGVNVTDAPTLPDRAAISLVEMGVQTHADAIVTPLLDAFFAHYPGWQASGFAALLPYWERASLAKETPLQLHQGDRRRKGRYAGVSPQGHLLLRLEDGTVETIRAGEVMIGSALCC